MSGTTYNKEYNLKNNSLAKLPRENLLYGHQHKNLGKKRIKFSHFPYHNSQKCSFHKKNKNTKYTKKKLGPIQRDKKRKLKLSLRKPRHCSYYTKTKSTILNMLQAKKPWAKNQR